VPAPPSPQAAKGRNHDVIKPYLPAKRVNWDAAKTEFFMWALGLRTCMLLGHQSGACAEFAFVATVGLVFGVWPAWARDLMAVSEVCLRWLLECACV
jgi:hypothetical protein